MSPSETAEYLDEIEVMRQEAIHVGDIESALWCDDKLEDLGMHPDHRATCSQCGWWADRDHFHSPWDGLRVA